MMENSVSSKTALVLGAAGGIGAATARRLLTAGACVMLTDRDHGALEQARAAKWDAHPLTAGTGPGMSDELPPTNYIQIFTNGLLVPATGQGITVTNYVSVVNLYTNVNTDPLYRELQADCVWRAPFSGKWFTNSMITYRLA